MAAWVEKFRRYLHAPLPCEPFDGVSPAPRDAVALPLVDDLTTLTVGTDISPQRRCDGCTAAELVYEVRVSIHPANIRKRFGLVKGGEAENSSDDTVNGFPHSSGMAREKKPEAIEIGERLRATREALGIKTARRMAQLTDEREDNISKWETGAAQVPPRFVDKMREIWGVDHNWIYGSDKSRLPHDLVLKLTHRD